MTTVFVLTDVGGVLRVVYWWWCIGGGVLVVVYWWWYIGGGVLVVVYWWWCIGEDGCI